MKANKMEEAYAFWYSRVRLPSEAVQENLRELAEYNQKMADKINTQNDVDYARSVKIILGIILAAVLLGVLIAWTVAQAIVSPLRAATRRLEIMAGGDYSADIEKAFLARGDEFGAMAQAFDKLNRGMRAMIRQVSQSSNKWPPSAKDRPQGGQQSGEPSANIASSLHKVAQGRENQGAEANDTRA